MARPESGLWDYLRERMPAGIHYSRIESLETSPGFPDVHYTLNGISGTMELKCKPKPTGSYPFKGTKDGLRTSQRIWIREELLAGGRVVLVLQAFQMIYFLPGQFHKGLDDFTIADIERAASLIWTRGGSQPIDSLSEILLN